MTKPKEGYISKENFLAMDWWEDIMNEESNINYERQYGFYSIKYFDKYRGGRKFRKFKDGDYSEDGRRVF